MPWAKLDDGFWKNPKIRAVGNDALAVYATAISYCANQTTDGYIDQGMADLLCTMRHLADANAVLTELVSARLFEVADGGYQIADDPRWKIGPNSTIQDLRKCREYEGWRQAVLRRDSFACTLCHSTEELHAHHVRAWAEYPNLRFSVDNGATLCRGCHMSLHGLMPAEEIE